MNTRRRKVLLAALVGAPVACIAVACTFPDVDFATGTDGSSGGAAETGASSSGSAEGGADGGNAAITDSSTPIEGPNDGALIDSGEMPTDAAQVVDTASCDARCDCDGDHWLRVGCTDYTASDDAAVEANKSKPDCDDTNSFIHPGQALNDQVEQSYANRQPPGDWNCSGKTEKAYNEDNCASSNPLAFPACPGSSFPAAVDCAKSAKYYKCVSTGISCTTGNEIDTRPQGCH